MRKLIASEWVSLDGVLDVNSMEQWFDPYHSDDRLTYLQSVIHDTDAILYGRVTYEMLAPYWSTLKNNEMGIADKLNSAPKYVVSTTLKKADWNNTTIISENVADEISRLKAQSGGDIHIEGSATLFKSLLDADLIDELWLLVHPYVVGSGKRLFKDGIDSSKLELIEAKTFSLGVVLMRYKVTAK